MNPNQIYLDAAYQSRSPAYCKGFVDGFYEGVRDNNYTIDKERLLYNIGYDAGVAEYCNANHPEE